ncbi:hypothetical protein F2Q69_00049328 [Brassica cretica]|uniref:Uncharacterized protein n=1 Tax=Brassica cretica TaxID=69181 RepID=A0A8S9Q5H8_BRACR|nr:hypothetical protein F2Q69_00049328 [Brassica cretica]
MIAAGGLALTLALPPFLCSLVLFASSFSVSLCRYIRRFEAWPLLRICWFYSWKCGEAWILAGIRFSRSGVMAWGLDLCVDCEALSLLRHPSSFSLGVSVGGSTVVRLVKTSSPTEQIYVRFSCMKACGTKDLWLCHPGSSVLWRRVRLGGRLQVVLGSTISLRVDYRACQLLLGYVSRIHWVPYFAASSFIGYIHRHLLPSSSGRRRLLCPLLVTTHSLLTSRSDKTRTRSSRRFVTVEPLSRLFPYLDFSDERSPSTPPTCEASCHAGSGSSISDDSPSHVYILFELCSFA